MLSQSLMETEVLALVAIVILGFGGLIKIGAVGANR